MKKLFAILFLTTISFNSFAQTQTTLNFLRQEIDPVTVGLGGSAAAGGAGLFSIKQNPAHLNQVQEWEILYADRGFQNLAFSDDLQYHHLSAAYRINDKHSLGLSWRNFTWGEVVVTDGSGRIIKKGTAKDFSVALVYGLNITKSLQAGISFKYLISDLVGATSNSWATDIGLKWQLFKKSCFSLETTDFYGLKEVSLPDNNKGIFFGAALLNAGPQVSFITPEQKDPIPQMLRLGFSWQVVTSPLVGIRTVLDFNKDLVKTRVKGYEKTSDAFYKAWFTAWGGSPFREAAYHAGVEVRLAYLLSFRFGVRYQPFQENLNNTLLTLGFGIDLKYFSIHYGKWLERENMSLLYKDSHVIGIRVGNIHF